MSLSEMQSLQTDVAIIGAGPTGLTAAYQLNKVGLKTVVVEKAALVGGIARTESYQDYHVDIGGHRFYTKVEPVAQLWQEVLGENFLHRPRLSRIYYNRQFFHYPIRFFETLSKLGWLESFRIGSSYLAAQLSPHAQEDNFEQWVSNRFGQRLYQIFFKTYTEKVWGLPCTDIKAEWAAQRIKGLSLPVALGNALFQTKRGRVKTLIEAFDYPRQGPGMLWNKVHCLIEEAGHQVLLNHAVLQINQAHNRVTNLVAVTPQESQMTIHCDHLISSIPLPELLHSLRPSPPVDLRQAISQLTYRDFLTVALIIRQPDLFPDNWIYIHNPDVFVGRIQNFKNWSPDMVPDPQMTCLGLEYFCTVGDELWQRSNEELIALGKQEVAQLGLAEAADVADGVVFRQPKAYPIYTGEYQHILTKIKAYLDQIPNLQTAGRNGLHRYNNQDHSMLTAMLAVENIMGANHDLWTVNTEQSYYEEMRVTNSKNAD